MLEENRVGQYVERVGLKTSGIAVLKYQVSEDTKFKLKSNVFALTFFTS